MKPYDGHRYQAGCQLAGKVYGQPFGVDVAFGDPMLGEVEVVTEEDLLAFAGVAPPTPRLYPVETHLAEKLHAYTLPRERPNTWAKDLPDLALLGTIRSLARIVRAALERVFTFRRVQPQPTRLPAPPEAWSVPCARMAEQEASHGERWPRWRGRRGGSLTRCWARRSTPGGSRARGPGNGRLGSSRRGG